MDLNDAANFAEPPDVFVPCSVQARHGNLGLLGHNFDHDFLQLLHNGFSHCDLPLPQLHHGLDSINLKAGVPSAAELIINLENPRVDVELIGDQFCELLLEIFFVVDVVCSHRNWHIGLLEDPLCS